MASESMPDIRENTQTLKRQLKNLAEGLEKSLDDLLLADKFPHLINLEIDLTESRRRQTELFQEIIKQAQILEMDIDQIFFEYEQALTRNWEDQLSAEMTYEADLQAFNQISLALLNKQEELAMLVRRLQNQIQALESQLQQIYFAVATVIADTFNNIIRSIGDERFTIPEYKIDIKLADVIAHVRDGLVNLVREGNISAENFNVDKVLNDLTRDKLGAYFKSANLPPENFELAASLLRKRVSNLLATHDKTNNLRTLLSEARSVSDQIGLLKRTAQDAKSGHTPSPEHKSHASPRTSIYASPKPAQEQKRQPPSPPKPDEKESSKQDLDDISKRSQSHSRRL